MPVKERQALTDRSNVTLSAGDDVTQLPVDKIRTDGGTQMRGEYNPEAIDDYVAAWNAGQRLPPITVYFDGQEYWLADGFHRLKAWQRYGGGEQIEAAVKAGTRREAILHAAGANANHGLRRTTADKRRAIMALLSDSEWSQWSDREIARHCKVDHKTVGAVRKDLESTGEIPQSTERKAADGRTMNTQAINAGRITLGQVERQLMRCAESIADAGTRGQMLQDLIERKADWGWYGDLVRAYVDADTPDHLVANAAANVLAKFAPRPKPERSEPVYAETPEHPETPADLQEAGYVIEAHRSGWYHWKVANPDGPGATYGTLWETPQEAIDEARKDIARGVVHYGKVAHMSGLPQDLATMGWEWYVPPSGASLRLVCHGSRLVTTAFTDPKTPEQLRAAVRNVDAREAHRLYGEIFGRDTDLPDGYSLKQGPRGWQWQREIADGTTLVGGYNETQAEAVAAANKDWEARQGRKADKNRRFRVPSGRGADPIPHPIAEGWPDDEGEGWRYMESHSVDFDAAGYKVQYNHAAHKARKPHMRWVRLGTDGAPIYGEAMAMMGANALAQVVEDALANERKGTPIRYTITLDEEAYEVLRTAVRSGGLSVIHVQAGVKQRVKAAIEEAQRVE